MTMDETIQYFIAKCANFNSLKTCISSEKWACRDRAHPPHPREVLSKAKRNGKVILIFSVNNCHGWHGYVEVLTSPDNQSEAGPGTCEEDEDTDSPQNKHSAEHTDTIAENQWKYFKVKWLKNFAEEFGEQCLSSKLTEDMMVNNSPLNKSRNWQEIPKEVGAKLCSLIDTFYAELKEKQQEKLRKEREQMPPPFYRSAENVSSDETWRTIVNQVEKDLGKVILACPFGSQRYNLSTPESDTDMFIVYQARTRDILGFNPPKQTIKNSENQLCDYTIHEIYRYSELLVSGDARCVETLFLHEDMVVRNSPEWQELKTGKKHFLNRESLDKYLRDAQGSRGIKQLQKWCKEHPEITVLPKKMCKLLYVIVRLLQNARDIAVGDDLHVYREDGSPDREVLMTIRQGEFPVQTAWQIIHELESTILDRKDSVLEKTSDCKEFTESWLLRLRQKDFSSLPLPD